MFVGRPARDLHADRHAGECMASGSDMAGVPMMLCGMVYWQGILNSSCACLPPSRRAWTDCSCPTARTARDVVGESQMSCLV